MDNENPDDLVIIPVLVKRSDRDIMRAKKIKFAPGARRTWAIECGYEDDPEVFNRNVDSPGGYRERKEQEVTE